MKCYMLDCNKKVPESRRESGFITCSKKCAGNWNHLSWQKREKIMGKEYNHKGRRNNEKTKER